MKHLPILYIKSGCPWGRAARAFFSEHDVDLDIRDVYEDPKYMDEMIQISGQTKTPTLVDGDFIVADFSVDELLEEIRQYPEMMKKYAVEDEDNDN